VGHCIGERTGAGELYVHHSLYAGRACADVPNLLLWRELHAELFLVPFLASFQLLAKIALIFEALGQLSRVLFEL
jgi:hypothetical protein